MSCIGLAGYPVPARKGRIIRPDIRYPAQSKSCTVPEEVVGYIGEVVLPQEEGGEGLPEGQLEGIIQLPNFVPGKACWIKRFLSKLTDGALVKTKQ